MATGCFSDKLYKFGLQVKSEPDLATLSTGCRSAYKLFIYKTTEIIYEKDSY
jgi:hypothetical protein